MKIPLIHGLGVAFTTSVITLITHILGYWTDPEKLTRGMVIGGIGGLGVLLVGLVLGTRKARAEHGAAGFSYGQAFTTGWLVAVFAGLGGMAFGFIYFKFINPDFAETQIEWTRAFMERMNMPAAQMEQALESARAKATVGHQVLNGFLGNIFIGAIFAAITGAIMKRPPADELGEIPPALS